MGMKNMIQRQYKHYRKADKDDAKKKCARWDADKKKCYEPEIFDECILVIDILV
jgi:hypothetical protein